MTTAEQPKMAHDGKAPPRDHTPPPHSHTWRAWGTLGLPYGLSQCASCGATQGRDEDASSKPSAEAV